MCDTKQCYACGEAKPVADFYRDRRRAYAGRVMYHAKCKVCTIAAAKVYRAKRAVKRFKMPGETSCEWKVKAQDRKEIALMVKYEDVDMSEGEWLALCDGGR